MIEDTETYFIKLKGITHFYEVTENPIFRPDFFALSIADRNVVVYRFAATAVQRSVHRQLCIVHCKLCILQNVS